MCSIIVSFVNAGSVKAIIYLVFLPILYRFLPSFIIFGTENTRWNTLRDYTFRENQHKEGHDLRNDVKNHALPSHFPVYLAFN